VLLRHTHDLYKDSDFYGTIKAETIADEDQQQSVVDQNQ
jgi:hypothetical protein